MGARGKLSQARGEGGESPPTETIPVSDGAHRKSVHAHCLRQHEWRRGTEDERLAGL